MPRDSSRPLPKQGRRESATPHWGLGASAYRPALGLTFVFLLGASSTVAFWSEAATWGRPLATLLLLIATVTSTQGATPRTTPAARRIFFTLYLLAGLAALSTVWSVDPATSASQAAALLALVAIVDRSSSRRWIDRSAMVADLSLVATVVNIALLSGLVAYLSDALDPTYSGRFQGYLNNPNLAAQIAALALWLSWGLFLERPTLWRLAWLLPSLATLALAESRTAIVAVAVGAAWSVLRAAPRAGGTLVLVATSLGASALAFGLRPLTAVLSRFGSTAGGDEFSGRTFIWVDAIHLIRENPLGYGWGTTPTINDDARFDFTSFHSSYLQVAIEGGVIALLLVAAVYLLLIQPMIRTHPAGIGAGLSALTISAFVIDFTESGIFGVGQPYPYLHWLAVGALLALYAGQKLDQPATGRRDRST